MNADRNLNTAIDSNVQIQPAYLDLGNGMSAAVNISPVVTRTSVNASTTSAQILAADIKRLAATIRNRANTALHLTVGGYEIIVGAGLAGAVPDDVTDMAADAWWEGAPSGTAVLTTFALA